MIEQLQDIDNCVGYSSDEVLARYFDTTRKTVWIQAKEGKLPKPYKIGANTTRWKNSEVMDVVKNFLKKQRFLRSIRAVQWQRRERLCVDF